MPNSRYFSVILLLVSFAISAEAARCSVCKNALSGSYLTAEGKSFCSKLCHRRTLPTCASCMEHVSGSFVISEGKSYCGKKCLNISLPKCTLCAQPLRQMFTINGKKYCKAHADGHRCFGCGLPFDAGKLLKDGRKQCATCAKSAIFDPANGLARLRQARAQLKAVTGIVSASLPKLKLVDRPSLLRVMGEQGHMPDQMTARGFYRRNERTETRSFAGRVVSADTEVSETIFILSGLTPDQFLITAIHELTHDLISETYRPIADLPRDLEEGLCQYTAAMYCRKQGWMQDYITIDKSPDPIYGGGFRKVHKRFGNHNWKAIDRWLRTR